MATVATVPERAVSWRWLAAVLAVALVRSVAVAGDFDVYVTYSKGGMPVFTNTPKTPGAQPIFSYREAGGAGAVNTAASSTRRGGAGPTTQYGERYRAVLPFVHEAAHRYDIEPALLLAVMEVESRFQPRARSPAGAMGLMQLIPGTARRYGVTDPWDPRANIDGGSRYLRDLLEAFAGDLKLALAGYNAGEAAVVSAGWRVPRIAETQSYVSTVLRRLQHWRQALAPGGANGQGGANGPIGAKQ